MASAHRPGPQPFADEGDMAAHRMRALGLWGSELPTPGDVVRHLVAVQSQDHTVARWSVAQRMARVAPATEIDEAFDRGDLIRTHVLRPTWHYVSPDDLRWLMRLSGPLAAARAARYWAQFGLDARALAASTDAIARAVEQGPCTRSELGERLGRVGPELAAVVMHAELHMAVCSGPMRGRQHTYMAFDQRTRAEGPEGDEALHVLARRYFATRGPSTVDDFAWWAGLPMARARRGMDLASSDLEFHDEDGRHYAFVGQRERRTKPAIDLVQCYDEVVVSYRQTRNILKTPEVSFDPLGRADGYIHLILHRGRLLGHWRVARNKQSIEIRLSDAVSSTDQRRLTTQVDRLGQFLLG